MAANEPKPTGEIVLYQTEDGRTRVECRFANENIWLSQALMSELFQTTVPNINLHIKNILAEGELAEGATIKDYLIVRQEGGRQVQRPVKHYSLEMILAVGYRVKSPRGTAFRQWATARLKEYLVKGFVMDDERLKNPPGPGVPDYFDETKDPAVAETVTKATKGTQEIWRELHAGVPLIISDFLVSSRT